jgi:hypothetical protein
MRTRVAPDCTQSRSSRAAPCFARATPRVRTRKWLMLVDERISLHLHNLQQIARRNDEMVGRQDETARRQDEILPPNLAPAFNTALQPGVRLPRACCLFLRVPNQGRREGVQSISSRNCFCETQRICAQIPCNC